MKIVFSRKGFDSGSGGGPSPIVGGRALSLPIPEKGTSPQRYCDLGLGEMVRQASRNRIGPEHYCHHDPMFHDGRCWFGQCGPAQSHLANQGVGAGDVFLFFGLYADPLDGHLHHRIFAYLRIEGYGAVDSVKGHELWREPAAAHPHFGNAYGQTNNTIWFGSGATNAPAFDELRLTAHGVKNRPSLWEVPPWLSPGSLSYHKAERRWLEGYRLQTVGRGQEFVCDIGEHSEPRRWLEHRLSLIEGRSSRACQNGL